MRKWLPIVFFLFVTMYFFPHVWYFFIAVVLGLMVVTFCLAILAFLAKGLGIVGLEAFLLRKYMKHQKARKRTP